MLETLADNAVMNKDADVLTEYVRQSLKRTISNRFFDEDSNQVVTLDPSIEQAIMDSVKQTETGTYLALEPSIMSQIIRATADTAEKLTSMGRTPIILTSPIVRIYYKRMIEEQLPDIIVISYNEIDPRVELQSVGMVSLN